jgi:diguanylate cyclase (GGDEF)-like protein
MPRLNTSTARPPQFAWLITAPLAILAVPLALAAQINEPLPPIHWLYGVAYLGLFIAAEATVLHFEIRRHALSLSVTEVPLLLALFYLAPLVTITVRVLAVVVVFARRRQPPVRMWFNAAQVAVGAAVACLVVVAFGPLEEAGPRTWLVLAAAVWANMLTTLAAVVGVITLMQGGSSGRHLVRAIGPGLVITAVNITLGLVALLALQQSPWAVLLLAVVVTVFGVAYKSYARFLNQHHTLTELYELIHAIRDTKHDGTLYDVLLHRVRTLMRAEHATLWLPAQGRHPEVLLSARVEDRGLIDVAPTPETVRRRVVEEGRTIAVGERLGNQYLLAQLRAGGVKDAIAVPLRSGTAVIGCLEVASRLGAVARFEPSDIQLMEAVAAQAAVAVENWRLVDRLRFDAYHDPATGIPNRRQLLASLGEALKVRAPNEVVAVMVFDVDGMRDVNESLGRAAGDQVLAEVARRLRDNAPSAALVARVGGDEFAVTLRIGSAEETANLAAALRQALQEPMRLGTLAFGVDAAVGVAVHPDHASDPETLLQRADVAAHAAKSSPAAVQLFNLGLESRSSRRLGLAEDLRRALDRGELRVFFQPQISLRDRRLVGVECFARWEHPTHGSVSPEDFVTVAEHTGQLSRLTEIVLHEGLRRCREWGEAGRPLSVAVNLSPRSLLDPHFADRVGELLDEHRVAPQSLTLEITEDGVIGETHRPMPTLRRLHDMGVRLAVDDFGTGYSSLSYLRRLPVHQVKIDLSFVQGMTTDSGDLAIVRAVVDLSRHFGLTVVAEGVESQLTLDLLEEIGCDIGQGFLFSRPLPYERLEAWFGAQTETEPTPMGEVRRLRAVP